MVWGQGGSQTPWQQPSSNTVSSQTVPSTGHLHPLLRTLIFISLDLQQSSGSQTSEHWNTLEGSLTHRAWGSIPERGLIQQVQVGPGNLHL